MNVNKNNGLIILFWIFLIVLSLFWIVFNFLNFEYLIFIEPILQAGFILSYISITIAVITIYEILNHGNLIRKTDKSKNKENEENDFSDLYKYNHLMDPPDSDMYN